MKRVLLGPLSRFSADVAEVVPVGGQAPKTSVIVVDTPRGLRAYWNVCRHLPTALDDGSGVLDATDGLVCRSHGARYTIDEGLCYSGPCRGKWLERVTVSVDDGQVYAELDE
jgi:nitrite reductase/ring-hydroxylating ferredoxin subunit